MQSVSKDEGKFQYKWTLYSAGHADLDTTKEAPKDKKEAFKNRLY